MSRVQFWIVEVQKSRDNTGHQCNFVSPDNSLGAFSFCVVYKKTISYHGRWSNIFLFFHDFHKFFADDEGAKFFSIRCQEVDDQKLTLFFDVGAGDVHQFISATLSGDSEYEKNL